MGPISFLPRQNGPCDPRELIGERDGDQPERLFLQELSDPIRHGRCLVLRVPDDGGSADNEQSAQVSVSLLGDAAELRFASGRMLLRRQAEPGGKLPARAELIGIGDGSGDSRGCDYAEAGDSGKPATGLAVGMPSEKLLIQRSDLIGKHQDLPDQNVQRSTGIGGQAALARQRLLRQLRQIGDTGIGDKTELCQMRPQRIGDHRALANEQRSGAVGQENALLFHRLHGHESHRRALNGFADCFSIQRIALTAFD